MFFWAVISKKIGRFCRAVLLKFKKQVSLCGARPAAGGQIGLLCRIDSAGPV